MTLPIVVPDASVILKWVLPADDELDVAQARLLREAIADENVKALVPAQWLYEVGNTLTRRFPAEASGLLTALMKFDLQGFAPSRRWMETAVDLVCRHGVTFYDAAYHAIALIHRGNFVTADVRYANRVGEVGSIVLLRDWSPTY